MRQKGFTLIEIMAAIGIMAVLGTLGIAGFSNYNETQVLQTSANEVATMLNLAKSRAQSQVKPSEICPSGSTLDGYDVEIIMDRSYALYVRCSGVDVKVNEQDKILPASLKFDANHSFFFPIQTGGVQAASYQIVISNSHGKTKTISVNSLE